jgi:hypothetical protein
MQAADAIENRWQQREAWRKLAGRIAQITIRIRSTSKFHPVGMGNPTIIIGCCMIHIMKQKPE